MVAETGKKIVGHRLSDPEDLVRPTKTKKRTGHCKDQTIQGEQLDQADNGRAAAHEGPEHDRLDHDA